MKRFLLTTTTKLAFSKRGSTAILFGLMAPVFFFAAGTGIDYARTYNERVELQAAVDAAALAAAVERVDNNGTDAEVRQVAKNAFDINYSESAGTSAVTPVVTIDPNNGRILVTATQDVPMTLTGIFGFERLTLDVRSTAESSLERVEIVLALDQSGSMAQNNFRRQRDLEAALEDFTESIYSNADAVNNLFVGVVPWQTTVNIGRGTARENWLRDTNTLEFVMQDDIADDFDDEEDFYEALEDIDFEALGYDGFRPDEDDFENILEDQGFDFEDDADELRWRGCVVNRNVVSVNGFDRSSFDLSISNRTSLAADIDVLDPPVGADRLRMMYQPPIWGNGVNRNDRRVTWDPFTDGRNDRGPNVGCIRQPMEFFLNDRFDIDNVIDALDPRDDTGAHTDSSLGMMWALRMLDPRWREHWVRPGQPADLPLSFGSTAGRKVVVLMTDGRNGISTGTYPESWSAYQDTRDNLAPNIDNFNNDNANATLALDIRTLRLCDLARSIDVTVYTIGFELPNAGTAEGDRIREMLRNCATQESFFFDTRNRSALSAAFEQVAQQVRRVALTQ
ncbi:MAG: pilus assembly protein TadG-related protein [Pseudomonadota bacterium]